MKLLASLAFGMATFVATSLGLAQPAMADDDVTVGIKLGPVCVGLCIDGDDYDGGRDYGRRGGDECYDFDCDGTGFYSGRAEFHQRYDRRDSYDQYADYRDTGYNGYRRNGHHRRDHGKHHGKPHGGGQDNDGDDGDDEGDDD